MSFDNFKKYLNESLNHPNNSHTDWVSYNSSLPNLPCTLDWASTDSDELFKIALNNGVDGINSKLSNRIPKARFNETVKYYLDNPISYELNPYKFRSDEFSTELSGNVFLGCSDTFGVGHLLEHSWPYILTKLRFPNYKIYNLGAPGSGSDTHFRLLNVLKDKMKIKNIFHWLPIRSRFEIYLDHGIDGIRYPMEGSRRQGFSTISPAWEIDNDFFSKNYIKYGLMSETMRNINDLKNILAIKNIADELGVPYYLANFEGNISSYNNKYMNEVTDYFNKNNIPIRLLARDFQHMEIFDSAKVVAHFLQEINDLSLRKSNKNII